MEYIVNESKLLKREVLECFCFTSRNVNPFIYFLILAILNFHEAIQSDAESPNRTLIAAYPRGTQPRFFSKYFQLNALFGYLECFYRSPQTNFKLRLKNVYLFGHSRAFSGFFVHFNSRICELLLTAVVVAVVFLYPKRHLHLFEKKTRYIFFTDGISLKKIWRDYRPSEQIFTEMIRWGPWYPRIISLSGDVITDCQVEFVGY